MTTTAPATRATLEGVTIEMIRYTHDDGTPSYSVSIEVHPSSTTHRVYANVGTWEDARRVANAAWRAVRAGVGAHECPRDRVLAVRQYATR